MSSTNAKPLRVLVHGASNLALGNVLERLRAPPSTKSRSQLKVTGVGYPARILSDDDVLGLTLDMKAGKSDGVGGVIWLCSRRIHGLLREAALAKDVKDELLGQDYLGRGKVPGKSPRDLERKKVWEELEVQELWEGARGPSIVVPTCYSFGGR